MTNEKGILKTNLKRIKENGYKLRENEKVPDYLELMLKYIGDTDQELRDELILNTFVNWIEEKSYFTNDELKNLLDTILSEDFAFYKMGEVNDDSVLKRSFSILLVNPILCVHLSENFLDREVIEKTKTSLITYLKEERDLRGYDSNKGWIHALAHVADGLDLVVNCEGITEETCKEILLAIEVRLCEGKEFLSAEEDERFTNIIYYNIIEDKLLSDDYICNWIQQFGKVLKIDDRITKFIARTNVKNFLRSLYFRMIHIQNNERISESILEIERKLNIYID